MLLCQVNDRTGLRLVEPRHAAELFALIDSNREHLRRWHGWVDSTGTVNDVEKSIDVWQQQLRAGCAFQAGIWFDGRLCGIIGHLHLDTINRWTALTYWLDAAHQGRGIMTAVCRWMIRHSFQTLKLDRVTIECATENVRSRAIPERLGFTLEGVVRHIEWLHDRHVDHAIYGLLRSDTAACELLNAQTGFNQLPLLPAKTATQQITASIHDCAR